MIAKLTAKAAITYAKMMRSEAEPRDIGCPPLNPHHADGDFAKVEEKLGTTLPSDYKAYIRVYGTGLLAKHIVIFNPFDPRPEFNLFHQIEIMNERIASIGDPEDRPPLFPAAEGYLLFGRASWDSYHVYMFWKVIGQAEDWGVVLNEGQDLFSEYFMECGFWDYLSNLKEKPHYGIIIRARSLSFAEPFVPL